MHLRKARLAQESAYGSRRAGAGLARRPTDSSRARRAEMTLDVEYLAAVKDDLDGDESELRDFARRLDEQQPTNGPENALLASAANAVEDAARKLSDAQDYLRDLIAESASHSSFQAIQPKEK